MRKLTPVPIVLAIGLVAASLAAAQPAALPAKTSDAGGVRVVVKPTNIGNGPAWEFEVTMDTHSKPLTEDLTKISVLIADGQDRYAPLAWQGDPPGGHHRKGLLRFPAPAKKPVAFEVQFDGLGGPGKRVLQWKAN